MVNLYPPRKYLPWIVLGFVLVVIINGFLLLSFGLLVPFIATILASMLVPWFRTGKVSVRKFFMFAFWITGLELVLLGILIILGVGLVAVISAAASTFFTAPTPLLGAIFVVLGVVSFIIGNLVSE